MDKGEIYKLKKEFRDEYDSNCYIHPFIFWEPKGSDINGIMITCSNNSIYSNVAFEEFHFEKGHKIGFGKSKKHSKSYFAPLYLLKEIKFEHLEKVGKLTTEGIQFLESKKHELEYTDWKIYMSKIRN